MIESAAASIDAVIVLHESASVIEGALESLRHAAPIRGVRPIIIDNASTDDGPAIASRILGADAVVTLPKNLGFAGGVNAGLARSHRPWLALVNPDLRFAPGALDYMASALESRPGSGLVGPIVRAADGTREETAGAFPTLDREIAHAWFLDRILGWEGRRVVQPTTAAQVDWVSGCAWLLRREAVEAVGPLDDGYFMYVEDVDYCKRLRNSGWDVWVEPGAEAIHVRGTGSTRSALLPADGGMSLVRYFERHASEEDARAIRAVLRRGWLIRRVLHTLRSWFGQPGAGRLAARYARAIEQSAARARRM